LAIGHPINQQLSKIPNNLAAVKISVVDIYNVSGIAAAGKRKQKQKGLNYRQLY